MWKPMARLCSTQIGTTLWTCTPKMKSLPGTRSCYLVTRHHSGQAPRCLFSRFSLPLSLSLSLSLLCRHFLFPPFSLTTTLSWCHLKWFATMFSAFSPFCLSVSLSALSVSTLLSFALFSNSPYLSLCRPLCLLLFLPGCTCVDLPSLQMEI